MKDIKPKTVGWMYPKGSVLQPLFDSYWLKLYQNGVIEKLYQRFLPPPICPNKDSYYEVNFEFAGMIFYLLILGLLLAIIVGIGEKIKAKLQKKKHSTRLTQSADFQPPSAEHFNTDFDSDFYLI